MVSLRLMPRDARFFELFISDAQNLRLAATELVELLVTYEGIDERIRRIQELEHQGDEIGDEITARLDDAFITPFDREDIHELARRLDDIVDGIQETAEAMRIYDIAAPTQEARELAGILAEQTMELDAAMGKLESMKGLNAHLRRVHELENRADGLSRAAVGVLFRDARDPLEVIKWRDVYGMLEGAIDAAEDAAEIVQRMLHKAS
jgi:predicted phosphate transport protein (TIGR00153 family)